MIRRIATVGGLTLVSRLTGFLRDVVMAAVLGAGPLADAFFVAFRLPNHFRAIFAEGAFAAAFVPAYARTLQQAGLPAAKLFADQIGAALITINLVLLAIAMIFTPEVVSVLAPGLDPMRFDLAVALTRITFPYLALVSIETLFAGILNANNRFAAAAGAPILLNLSIIATLLLKPFFQDAGHAAAWGVLLAAGINVLLKILLMGHLAQVGLAAATSVGAWINLSLLAFFARRQGFAVSGAAIGRPVAMLALSGATLGAALVAGAYGLERALAHMAHFREETILGILIVWGILVYGGAVLVLLGQKWFMSLLRDVGAAADTKAPALLPAPDPTDDSAALPDSEPPPLV